MTAGGTTPAPTMTAPTQVWDDTTFGPGVQYMGSGDFNGDSKADLALYYHYTDDNGQHDALFTMTGNGTGSLSAPVQAWNSTTFGPGVNSMAVGDFNGDGKSDIALFYDYSNPNEVGQVALFTTNGSTFNAPTNMWAQSDWGPNTEYMDAGDFNGDGKSDIALYYNYVQQIPAEFTLTADSNGDGGFDAPVRRFADE